MRISEILKKFSLKVKLLGLIISIALMTVSVVTSISYLKSKDALINQATNQLQAQGKILGDSLDGFLQRTKKYTTKLSRDRLIEGLLIAYESSFYGSNFDPGSDLDIFNKFYANLDKLYGERKRKILEEFDLKDILLVNLDGQVVFTANNDKYKNYLGRNLPNGAFKGTRLHTCYEKALEQPASVVTFSGFEYDKVADEPVAFLCSKKAAEFANQDEGIDVGDDMGVVIVQVDTESINRLMTNRTGMGETGQAFVVGEDKLLRSDFFLNKEQYNTKNSLLNGVEIDTESVRLAIKEQEGIHQTEDVMGEGVLSYYSSYVFMDYHWAVIAEKRLDEIFEPIMSMLIFIVSSSIALFVVMIFISLVLTGYIIKPIDLANQALEKISSTLREGAETLRGNSTELNNGADEVASSIEETVSTMNELTGMVNQNLTNVQQSSDASNQMTQIAQEGKGAINNMLKAMDEISDNNNNVLGTMNAINQQIIEFKNVINEISDKTNVINDIVFQTKLLSFNASVEAARAGEHGKGFAVVAEEIGNLATESGKAASEISELLEQNVAKVEEIVNDTNSKIEHIKQSGTEKIELGTTTAGQCENSLNEIINSIEQVSGKIREISVASKEQARGISDVTQGMSSLSKITNNTSSIATANLESSDSLLNDSDQLNNLFLSLNALVQGGNGAEINLEEKEEAPKTAEVVEMPSDDDFEDITDDDFKNIS